MKRALLWVRKHERATGGKTNEAKFQGIRMGSQKTQKPPWESTSTRGRAAKQVEGW